MGIIDTKTFKSGNSVAVRLPKAVGIGPDVAVRIEYHGSTVTIRPAEDPAEEKRKLLALVEALRALPAPATLEKRRPPEFPERRGL